VVVFDINNLKVTNDTLGHEAGDELIKSACAIICKQFKHSPVFRIGGDEFAAILKGSDFENREDLFREFTAKIDENNKNGGVVVAGGMAVFDPKLDDNYTDVFMRADHQMFERKEQLKASKAAG
jgi:diguanylate cyclase (GGDEF)-like protein